MRKIQSAILAMLLCSVLTGCGAKEIMHQPVPAETQSVEDPVVVPGETLPAAPEPDDAVFVAVSDYLPELQIQLKYATEDNFTGQVVYGFSDAFLRYGTVKKLAAVQKDLQELGLGLKLWDGFRPVSAQFRLWEICPDPRFVANPETSFSSHSRGNTVDVTLVDALGTELEMPTAFDDFSPKADRDYSDCTEEAAAHAQILELLMEKHGFSGYKREWWHFTDTDVYPVEEQFLSE